MEHRRNRRRGQTLAEFAITLPILLIMIFGIIEFGRLFQAWVSLQNAARAAARYASTGNINYDIFIPNDGFPDGTPNDIRVLESIVPCNTNTDNGIPTADVGDKVEVNGVQVYNGVDGLFATWYDGTDCEPSNEEHQQLRKDILRLLSVMNEARESVNALSVEAIDADTHYYEQLKAPDVQNILYGIWSDPMARELNREWFNVMICSSRGLLDPVAAGTAGSNRTINPSYPESRFVTVRTESEVAGLPDGTKVYPMPYCMLNEIPPPPLEGNTDYSLNHAGIRWLDAGGPGDRVTIAVEFNHPLITPLRTGAENFIPIESRRSIVNESFRAPKAIGAFQKSLPAGNTGNPGSQITPTASVTPAETETPDPSRTPSNTPEPTKEPFSCNKLVLLWGSPPFDANRMYLLIENNNAEQVELTRFMLSWPDLKDHPNMYMGFAAMGDIHWSSTDPNEPPKGQASGDSINNVKSNGNTTVDSGSMVGGPGYRFVAAYSDAVWESAFFSGPSNLGAFMTLYDFDVEFTFLEPLSNTICKIVLTNPEGGEPTDEPTPTIGPSPSPTPNCVTATNLVKFRFGGFDTFGGVYFEFENNSGRDLMMSGFRFYWPDRTHPHITSEPAAGYFLARVIVGGTDVLDGTGQRVWQGNVTQGNTSTNPASYNNPTYGGDTNGQGAPVGTWLGDGTLKAGVTRIWLDFDSFPGNMYNFGARPWHFDKSKLYFNCVGGGGGGGGGDSDDGDIEVPIPSPTITKTPKPTNTLGPTNTTGPATATRTATKTRTPAPVTLTFTPIPPTLTPSKTPIGVNTPPPSGGGE